MGKRWLLRLRVPAAVWLITAVCTVTAFADGALIPVGETVGIQIRTEGVLVAGVSEVETDQGAVSPARDAGVRSGDMITAVDGQTVSEAADVLEAVEHREGGAVQVTLRRNGEERSVAVTPARESGGGLRLGLWLRDGVAGIGTVTYIDPDTGSFGALGHGVNDLDTGVLLPVADGDVYQARIVDVKRGAAGAPGELAGAFDGGAVIGRVDANTPCGVFGVITGNLGPLRGAVPVGEPSEVHKGEATILACVDGQDIREYTVEISRTGMASGGGRDLMVRVTDPELLARTGGIVQGMSGSPILQDGKLVGAVTHVCVIAFMPTGNYCFMGIFG